MRNLWRNIFSVLFALVLMLPLVPLVAKAYTFPSYNYVMAIKNTDIYADAEKNETLFSVPQGYVMSVRGANSTMYRVSIVPHRSATNYDNLTVVEGFINRNDTRIMTDYETEAFNILPYQPNGQMLDSGKVRIGYIPNNKGYINVREEPNTDANTVRSEWTPTGQAMYTSRFIILNSDDNGFTKVRIGSKIGYIMTDFIGIIPATAGYSYDDEEALLPVANVSDSIGQANVSTSIPVYRTPYAGAYTETFPEKLASGIHHIYGVRYMNGYVSYIVMTTNGMGYITGDNIEVTTLAQGIESFYGPMDKTMIPNLQSQKITINITSPLLLTMVADEDGKLIQGAGGATGMVEMRGTKITKVPVTVDCYGIKEGTIGNTFYMIKYDDGNYYWIYSLTATLEENATVSPTFSPATPTVTPTANPIYQPSKPNSFPSYNYVMSMKESTVYSDPEKQQILMKIPLGYVMSVRGANSTMYRVSVVPTNYKGTKNSVAVVEGFIDRADTRVMTDYETEAFNIFPYQPNGEMVDTGTIRIGYIRDGAGFVNVRQAPSLDADLVKSEVTYPDGQISSMAKSKFIILGDGEDGFYKVRVGSKIGYIMSDFVSIITATAAYSYSDENATLPIATSVNAIGAIKLLGTTEVYRTPYAGLYTESFTTLSAGTYDIYGVRYYGLSDKYYSYIVRTPSGMGYVTGTVDRLNQGILTVSGHMEKTIFPNLQSKKITLNISTPIISTMIADENGKLMQGSGGSDGMIEIQATRFTEAPVIMDYYGTQEGSAGNTFYMIRYNDGSTTDYYWINDLYVTIEGSATAEPTATPTATPTAEPTVTPTATPVVTSNAQNQQDKNSITNTTSQIISSILNSVSSVLDKTDLPSGKLEEIKQEIQDAIARGDEFITDIVSRENTAPAPAQAKEELKTVADTADAQLVCAYDISVSMHHVDQNGNDYPIGNITQLDEEITITFDLPKGLPEAAQGFVREYYLVRQHGKAFERIPVSVANGKATANSKYFSTFYLFYVDKPLPNTLPNVPQTPAAPVIPKTGDNSNPVLAALLLLAAVGTLLVLKKRAVRR